jgi:hypothetical protein
MAAVVSVVVAVVAVEAKVTLVLPRHQLNAAARKKQNRSGHPTSQDLILQREVTVTSLPFPSTNKMTTSMEDGNVSLMLSFKLYL